MDSQLKLFDQIRTVLRLKHYAYKTEVSYIGWIKRFVAFHQMQSPRDLGLPEVEAFLSHLAVTEQVAASTQNQALSALLFLDRQVYHLGLDWQVNAVRARPTRYLPTVLTYEAAIAMLNHLFGAHQLLAQVLYGSGLRLSEGLRLRVKELDFAHQQIVVRDTKGQESRVTMLPQSLVDPLTIHLQRAKQLHQTDLHQGYGAV